MALRLTSWAVTRLANRGRQGRFDWLIVLIRGTAGVANKPRKRWDELSVWLMAEGQLCPKD